MDVERKSDPESSVDLLVRARTGDTAALDRLLKRYRSSLRRWAHGRLPQRIRHMLDTEDLVQDTIIHTIRKIDTFQPRHDGALQAYLRTALLNRLRDEIRKHDRKPEHAAIDSNVPDAGPSPLEQSVGVQDLERYEAALETLREEDRELIVLRLEMGLSYEELAREVGKPSANAARMSVLRALVRLGEEIARKT